MQPINFDNRFLKELPGDSEASNYTRQVMGAYWSKVKPTPVSKPQLIIQASEVAKLLGISEEDMGSKEMVSALAGNSLLPGMESYATCYGGHQFGNWAGQLGDGRAILLGELINPSGQRFELQLKGAGPTPYSRRADGRAVLRSSIREFLCSEAMFHLGVPTTRALSLVLTGDKVMRDMFYDGNPKDEAGAIVCRVSPSFTRFGHFELPASRGDITLLKQMIKFTIQRDFPELVSHSDLILEPDSILTWFKIVCERTAIMIAHWMRVGFVHGVMNTDNMSILGLTIDYGPYGWIDNFDPLWTPNTTDLPGKRYCFGRQPEIARWNLVQLANALSTVVPDTDALEHALIAYDHVYTDEIAKTFKGKFGFLSWRETEPALVNSCFQLLYQADVDMTLFFTLLSEVNVEEPSFELFKPCFYDKNKFTSSFSEFNEWLKRYVHRLSQEPEKHETRSSRMKKCNPRYVLRNYLAQQAIELAENGDYSMIKNLLNVLRHPYELQAGQEKLEEKRPDWAKVKAGCSMLSCSS